MDENKFYCQQLKTSTIIPIPEQNRLLKIIRESKDDKVKNEAITTLFNGMIRLVFNIAKKYQYFASFYDLVSIGKISLMEAIKRCDNRRGSLSTIATILIIRDMDNFAGDKTIRYPRQVVGKAKLMRNIEASGYNATPEEMRKKLKVSSFMFESIASYRHSIVSLDAPIKEDSDEDVGDFFTFKSLENTKVETKNPSDKLAKNERVNLVQKALGELDAREKDIILSRWLTDDRKSLRQIAKNYKCTAECIRLYEVQAIKKIEAYVRRKIQYDGVDKII